MSIPNRSGAFIKQPFDYKAFVPRPLPPDPPLVFDTDVLNLLSLADRSLGRLDGITEILPNPDLFVAMYVKKEAVLSSQIEGTQASLIDVLDVEDVGNTYKEKNVEEVINYIKAMNYGLNRLEQLPLSLRLLREIHEILLENVRGAERSPGEFRKTQNWIGPPGCTLKTATFVPPPHHDMLEAMNKLETYFYADDFLPPLVKIGLVHAQFETIHPFLDGNGRMGRLLITFWLCQQKILTKPLLYLSYFFKINRTEYYDRLMDIRLKGDWENWIKFFLKGIAQVSAEATETAKKILKMKDENTKTIKLTIKNPVNGLRLLEKLFEYPIITINKVAELLDVTYPTANSLVAEFCNQKILTYDPKIQRNKKFRYLNYIELLESGTEL